MYSKFVDYFSIYKQTLCLHLTSTNFKVKGILRIFFFFFFFFLLFDSAQIATPLDVWPFSLLFQVRTKCMKRVLFQITVSLRHA